MPSDTAIARPRHRLAKVAWACIGLGLTATAAPLVLPLWMDTPAWLAEGLAWAPLGGPLALTGLGGWLLRSSPSPESNAPSAPVSLSVTSPDEPASGAPASFIDPMRELLLRQAPWGIFVLDGQGVIIETNPAGEHLLGHGAGQLAGHHRLIDFFDPIQVRDRLQRLALRQSVPVESLDLIGELAIDAPGLSREWTLLRPDGRSMTVELSGQPLGAEPGGRPGVLLMAHDVTLRREAEHQLQHLSMHDALTALPNRHMLQEQLRLALAAAERGSQVLALMFIDLDRFKKVNDTLGHHIGDSILSEVARRLRSGMRTSDIVARLGGDEFVVLLPSVSEAGDAELVARKVMSLFAEPVRVGQHEIRITPSIGLVIHPEHGQDAITLMRHADLAMYQAKSRGRNRIQIYSAQLESFSPEMLVLENDLYKALERQELRLHYQPQFDCTSGQIIGAEALLRWEHDGRLVPPADFIPLAEESGLIVAIGDWVLREACQQARQWHDRTGWPLRMAVNLSAVQLEDRGLSERVQQILRETGLPPSALELEITESVLVRESLRAAAVLSQLRALGLSVAIDDFGVGYSSFSYLRELPVDRFKLDRSFLSGIPHSAGDARLAAALIAMAHRLDVGIVAEGVETAEHAAFLRDHGCDEAQGYHLGRPMTPPQFEALLTEHSRQCCGLFTGLRGGIVAA